MSNDVLYHVCGLCDEPMRYVAHHYKMYHPESLGYRYKLWPDGTVVQYTEADVKELDGA